MSSQFHTQVFCQFIVLLFVFAIWSVTRASLVTQYISQPVDHFSFGTLNQLNFKQKVLLDFSFCANRQNLLNKKPILVFFGGNERIETSVGGSGIGPGILISAASHFQALVVYIEHRFYGESVPEGSIDLAMSDVDVRGCLTSAQALADFADVIISLKVKYFVPDSPVIVMGGSYGGMLAAWFRLKYPHIVVGALASSAPVISTLELPVKSQYCSIVSKDFRDTSQRCFDHISKSWALIDGIAAQPNGLKNLTRIFKACSPLLTAYELKNYLTQMYRFVAQYNGRYSRLHLICDEIANVSDDNILEGISRATLKFWNQQLLCSNITWMAPSTLFYSIDPEAQKAWNWQMCSELLSAETGNCSDGSMFEPSFFNISDYMKRCHQKYGVYPQPTWMSKYYGGQELKLILKTFGSNIIFSNGLKDPLSGACILKNLSDKIVAINTKEGSHALDMVMGQEDDPNWLRQQRQEELKVLSKWIKSNGAL